MLGHEYGALVNAFTRDKPSNGTQRNSAHYAH